MTKFTISKISTCILIVIVICLSALFPMGCGNGDDIVTTPEATNNATPEVSTSIESTPESIPESTPEPTVTYSISYDLDGGIDGGNPAKYSGLSDLTLSYPIRVGYTFTGWTGSGLSEPTKKVTIKKGTAGDLSYKANWEKAAAEEEFNGLNTEFFNRDDGLEKAEDTPVSVTDLRGLRGEGIHLLKTVYTDITVNGEMDAAYTYGVHLKSDIPNNKINYEKGHKAFFDLYMVRGQDGKVYVYIDVTDSDIVVNEYLFKTLGKPHWCDCLHVYYELGNEGKSISYYEIVADPTGKYVSRPPKDYKLVKTDKGYAVEFALEMTVDEMSIGVYLNETSNWDESTKTYDRVVLKHSSILNPTSAGYLAPTAKLHDAVRCVADSASGRVDVYAPKAEKSGDLLKDIANRADTVAIIYDENATAQTILSAEKLKKYLNSCGSRVFLRQEDEMDASESYGYYILMGMTSHNESRALIDQLDYNGYGISISGNKISMVGWNEEAAYTAYDMLFHIIKSGIEGASINDFGNLYLGITKGIADSDIPRLEGFDSITDVGEGAYSIYKLEATADEYTAYISALEDKGFKLHTTNEINTVKFATYYNDDTVVNVQFAGGAEDNASADRSLRVVIEPLSNTALPALEKPSDADAKVTVSSVTMLCPEDKGTSLCMVIQLSNGEFIIIDSGTNKQHRDLYNFLVKKAPDKKPVIAAWIMTHFHQDHIGGFVEYSLLRSYFSRTVVKNIIYNFPPQQIFDNSSYSTVDMSNINKWPELMEKYRETGTTVYQARTGQKYYFGNAEIEILFSYEDIMPFNVFYDRSNPTCIGFTVEIEGQKIMFTGDASREEFTVAYKKYENELKCDFVQLSHHGQGDGGSPKEFYQYVDAKYVFSPGSSKIIAEVEKWACNNAISKGGEVYIRDEDGTVTLVLPYNGKE